jgi:hypothetical protein
MRPPVPVVAMVDALRRTGEPIRMSEPALFYAVLVPATAVAGFVRGFAGFGGPMLLLPVAGAFLTPAGAIWLVMWMDIAVVLSLIPGAMREASRRLVAPLTIGGLATMPLGTWALIVVEPGVMRRLICAAIVAACLVLLSGWRPRAEAGPARLAAAGAVTGVIVGATSIAVTAALALQAAAGTAAEARASFIVWCLPQSAALLALLAWQTPAAGGQLGAILALMPVYIGTALAGARLHGLVSDRSARRAATLLALLVALAGLVG